MVCVCFYISRAPNSSPDSGSGEAGDQTCDPCFTWHNTYPLHQGGFKLHLIKYLLFLTL